MKTKKTISIFIMAILIVMTIKGAMAEVEECYQETANISTICGGLDTGNYKLVPNYLYINYTIPENVTSIKWQVKHGDLGIYNVTIPNDCWYDDTLRLRFYTTTSTITSYGQCYNQTNWNTITNISDTDDAFGYSQFSNMYLRPYDEDWDTYAFYLDLNGWANTLGGVGNEGAKIYEEGIWWIKTLYERANITFIPLNTTIKTQEGENISFDMNITQGYGSEEVNIFRWLLNGITKSFNKAWTWIIGQQDAGNHTIVGIANDSIGEVARQIYDVEVEAINIAPEEITNLNPNKGTYDISVVISCGKVLDEDGDILYYEIQENKGDGWKTIANNTDAIAVMDLTDIEYGESKDVRCRATDGEYTTNWYNPSGNITRQEKFMYFMYDHRTYPVYTENKPYQLGVYANTANKNITITSMTFDCNGDRLTDYYKEYEENTTKVNEYYTCINLPGVISHIIGLNIERKSEDVSWEGICKTNEMNCTLERVYNLKVI